MFNILPSILLFALEMACKEHDTSTISIREHLLKWPSWSNNSLSSQHYKIPKNERMAV